MIGCHFEGSQHQDRLLHLLDAESGDAQDLTLKGHLISQKLNVTVVYLDAILSNSELDLFDDAASGSFDAEDLRRLHDMIRRCGSEVDAWGAHHLSKPIALNCQVESVFATLLFRDNSTLDSWHSFDDDVRQATLELLHDEVKLLATCFIRLNMHLVLSDNFDVLFFNFKLASSQNALSYRFNVDLQLECFNGSQVDFERQIAPLRRVNFFDVFRHITELSLFNPAFHDSGCDQTGFIFKFGLDYGS